jgi:hypothetical protein
MSPRAAATRFDATAHDFLSAAAALIDQAFASPVNRGRHPVNSMHFPAALDWLRIEDVVRYARQRGAGAASRKALQNRWPDKDSFVRDAVIHALLYRDEPTADPNPQVATLGSLSAAPSPSGAMAQMSDALLESLTRHPRSYLLLHLGPLLDQHRDLHQAVLERITTDREPWYAGYRELLDAWGLVFRPAWTVERFDLTLLAMLDGFLLRTKLQPSLVEACAWQGASLFADSVLAFTLGVLDIDRSGTDVGEVLDAAIHQSLE